MALADVVDSLLEATVIPSFTRIGPAVRSRTDGWGPPIAQRLDGRVVVVTGATSGLGFAAARAWAEAGAAVEIVARNPAKADATLASLRASVADAHVDATIADTADRDGVRRAAAEILSRHDRIDALVHNAGALDAQYATNADGIEQTVASQVVGPFLLSALLHDALTAAAPGRIVWVSSGGMYTEALRVDRLTSGPDGYRGSVAYARAKRAQVTLCEMMAERVDPARLVVHAMHPGWALTPGVERSLPTFRRVTGPLLRTPETGIDTLLWLVADDGAPATTTGRFWLDRRIRSIHKRSNTRAADTPDERARLWAWTTATSGTDFPPSTNDG